MRYFQTSTGDKTSVVVERANEYYDLSATSKKINSFREIAQAAAISDQSLVDLTEALCEQAPTVEFEEIRDSIQMPVSPNEVWGSGVTYQISQEAREDEGGLAEAYRDAYSADRPELYFKATPSRTVGPGEAVGIRSDSSWDVPEPELSIVLLNGEIVGYTVGNDVCSREIERENLLYLPQSKTYDRCCAIGPSVALLDDPHELEISMVIERNGKTVFDESTNTSKMVRTCEELASYFRQCNNVPELAVLLTGTSIIPPTDVTLEEDDIVEIQIEGIGSLRNPVMEV